MKYEPLVSQQIKYAGVQLVFTCSFLLDTFDSTQHFPSGTPRVHAIVLVLFAFVQWPTPGAPDTTILTSGCSENDEANFHSRLNLGVLHDVVHQWNGKSKMQMHTLKVSRNFKVNAAIKTIFHNKMNCSQSMQFTYNISLKF